MEMGKVEAPRRVADPGSRIFEGQGLQTLRPEDQQQPMIDDSPRTEETAMLEQADTVSRQSIEATG
jgi:hypothetical protein